MEERRRLWWAVLILDRYVHVGFRFRPLSTPKIPPDEILPARDEPWDIGVSVFQPSQTTSRYSKRLTVYTFRNSPSIPSS
jgi:hypothetical protein